MSQTKDSADHSIDRRYEPGSDEPPSMAVITAVAEATDRSPVEMEPLYWTIDPDALDSLLETTDRDDFAVTLTYCGCRVTVSPSEVKVDRRR